MIPEFSELAREQADEYCEHVVAREPYHLRDLARWMRATDGPIDAMDASLASLDPLWQWYVDLARRDFAGLTDGLVPSREPYLADPERTEILERARQSAAAGDRLMHYLRLVLDRLVPGAHWGVYIQPPKGPREADHQETVVFLPGHTYRWRGKTLVRYAELSPVTRFARRALSPTAPDANRSPTWLREWLTTYKLGEELSSVPQDRGPSVLADYLDRDLPPMPEIARITPLAAWMASPRSTREASRPVAEVGGEYTFAKGPALGLDDEPWLLAVLPADRVATALTEGGFIDDVHGDRIAAETLLAGEQVTHADGLASIDPFVHDGSLRALFIEPVSATYEAWERALAPLRRLASELGARLAPDDEFN